MASVVLENGSSLRERQTDIPTLATEFLQQFAQEFARPLVRFTDAAMKQLVAHPWPGNVRQLRDTIERTLPAAVPGYGHVRSRPGYHDVVEKIAACSLDPPFCNTVLPWCPVRGDVPLRVDLS